MAVPIVLGPEDAEETYRSLDFLLEQLLLTLRQVLMIRRREASSTATINAVRHRHVPSEGRTVDELPEQTVNRPEEATRVSVEELSQTNLPLPDIILETSPVSIQRRSQLQQKEMDRTSAEEAMAGTRTTTTTTTGTSTPSSPMQRTDSQTAQTHGWVQVGADLKRIADQLLATNRLNQMKNLVGTISLHAKIYSNRFQLAFARRFCRKNCCCCSGPVDD